MAMTTPELDWDKSMGPDPKKTKPRFEDARSALVAAYERLLFQKKKNC